MEREFEFCEGSSNKFWRIKLEGTSYSVTFGKKGTDGQNQVKTFASDAEAQKAYDKIIAEKVKKGYQEIGASIAGSAAAASSAQQTPATSPQVKTASAKSKAPVAVLEKNESDSSGADEPSAPVESAESESHPQVSQSAARTELALRLTVKDEDLLWCNWRPRTVEKRPPQRPFDRAACLKAVESTCKAETWRTNLLKKVHSPLQLSPEEAHFWLIAFAYYRDNYGWSWTEPRYAKKHLELVEHLKKLDFTTVPDEKALDHFLSRENGYYVADNIKRFSHFLSLAAVSMTDMINYLSHGSYDSETFEIMNVFRKTVSPYLSDEELESLRSNLRPKLERKNFNPDKKLLSTDPGSCCFLMAAFLGMHEKVAEALAELPNNWFEDYSGYSHAFVLSLGSKEQILSEWKRLKVPDWAKSGYSYECDNTGLYMRGLAATAGFDSVQLLVSIVADHNDKQQAERYFKIMTSMIDTPDLVPYMIELLNHASAHLARTWLEQHAGWSIQAVLDLANSDKATAAVAKDMLRSMAKITSAEDIGAELYQKLKDEYASPDDFLPVLTAETTPSWLAEALKSGGKKQALPDWADSRAVAAIVCNKHKLSPEQMEKVLQALKATTLEQDDPLITALRQNLETRAADRTVWWLFERWLKAGAPPKEKWAMYALGLLGSDDIAVKLTPMIKAWPGESQHQRAVLGLECLKKVGSDTALMLINGISQKLPFPALKAKASECMEGIATARGISRARLEDLIVPDCGLDERGRRIFDFGPRKFYFCLSNELKAMVKDEDGKVKSDLPKPGAKDDATLAEQALADWKLLKAQIKDVAKIQAFRLEQAMVTERRWTIEEFERLLVNHPLMINLVKSLVWSTIANGKPEKTFRVTEDQTLADVDDKPFKPTVGVEVGIIHPLNMSDNDRRQWSEILSDYELIPPFQQLGRQVYELTEEEKSDVSITRFAHAKVPAISILGTLEKLGWERGGAMDGGWFNEHSKDFPSAGIQAIVEYEGMGMGWAQHGDDQAIDRCTFYPLNGNDALRLADVPPIVISEVLSELSQLASKAK